MEIPPAFDEKSPVNFGPLTAWNYNHVSLDPLKCTFWETISALEGTLTALGMGGPIKK